MTGVPISDESDESDRSDESGKSISAPDRVLFFAIHILYIGCGIYETPSGFSLISTRHTYI